ncbi:MAG TPA: hypothetical protein VH276_14385 [Solirubrobacteraceae bacterium]|jgi:hypothetical protein|nr:hypothetical protein [Solirubrobacteraceae bacterium]
MSSRVIAGLALGLVVLLAVLTICAAVILGPDILTLLSLLVLAILGFGIFGALRQPPPRRR